MPNPEAQAVLADLARKKAVQTEPEDAERELAQARAMTGSLADYSGEAPATSVLLPEMFGVTPHPVIAPKRPPLRITLLSPAQKPVPTTRAPPGFWATSYTDGRQDMRGP